MLNEKSKIAELEAEAQLLMEQQKAEETASLLQREGYMSLADISVEVFQEIEVQQKSDDKGKIAAPEYIVENADSETQKGVNRNSILNRGICYQMGEAKEGIPSMIHPTE